MKGSWLVAAALMAAPVFAAETPAAEKPKPGVLEAAAATMTATVEKIDYKTREITLKGENGNVVTMVAGPEIVRFNEIKKGDTIQADYLEAVAVMVSSPSDKVATAEGSQSALVRNKTKKPSATMVQTDVVTATVVKVDAKARKATLKGPDGNTFDVEVAPDVEHLENVKKGDQVLVKVTRSLALAVHPSTKK